MVWLVVALAIGPFVIKRIILLGEHDYAFWLTVDYVARCVSLVGVALGFRSGLIERPQLRTGWLVSGVALTALLFAGFVEQTIVYPILQTHLNYFNLSFFPKITNENIRAVDLVFGLLLVAFSEELVFRRLLFSLLPSKSPLLVTILSAVIFAMIHLTSGLADTVNAFVYGILLGGAFWITRRISICIVAHYVVDFIIFVGLQA
jgi:membrane protease YdiL (CAAX protease family)